MSRNLRRLIEFFSPQVVWIFFTGIILGLCLAITEIAFAYLLQALLETYGVTSTQSSTVLPIWLGEKTFSRILLTILIVGTIRALINSVQIYLQSQIGVIFSDVQRKRILRYALNSKSVPVGDTLARFTEQVGNSLQVINSLQMSAISLAMSGLLLVQLCRVSLLATLASILFIILLAFPILKLDRILKRAGETQMRAWTNGFTGLNTVLKNFLLVKIYGLETKETKRLEGYFDTYRKETQTYAKTSAIKIGIPQITGVLLLCSILHFGTKAETLSSEVFVIFFYVFFRFIQSMSSAVSQSSTIPFYLPSIKALFNWWERSRYNALTPINTQTNFRLSSLPGWKLENISFNYPDDRKPIFNNFSLDTTPGKSLIIFGPSGVGKSTLLQLMIGDLEPQTGNISIKTHSGEVALKDCSHLMKPLIGYVGPESFILPGTVRENLVYGLERSVSVGEIESVLKRVACQFVLDSPKGIESTLDDHGQGLSAGQKQRLMLARALLRNPQILILDEATSNLDSATEEALVQELKSLSSEMTLLVVSHRPALKVLSDQILDLSR